MTKIVKHCTGISRPTGWVTSDAAKFKRTSGGINDGGVNEKQALILVRKRHLDHNTVS